MQEIFYIVVPYFNFINYKSGRSNLEIFINNLSTYKNVQMVLVEGYFGEEKLPNYSDKILKLIKFPLKHVMWVKENLINIGFQNLPSDWKYGGWIDRDVMFCNPNWASRSIEKLKECDVIQPWKEFLYLDKQFNYNTVDPIQSPSPHLTSYSFGFMKESLRNGTMTEEDRKKYFGHPGQAWGITREFFEKTGGLYEYGIAGGGDGIFWNCIKQDRIEDLLQWYWTLNFRFGGTPIIEYHKKCADAKIGYVDGLILHYYHGSVERKNYNYRYSLLETHKFEPTKDLTKDENGVLCFKEKNSQLEKDLADYFLNRKEDE